MGKIIYPAIFDEVDLNTIPGLTVLKTDPYRPARRTVSLSELIRTDKAKVTGAFYTERLITVRIELTRSTRALMEQSLDAMMNLIQGSEKTLILNQAGVQRKYYCTFADSVVDEESEGGSFLQMDLIFTCSDMFGYKTSADTLLAITTYTSAFRSDRLTFTGSAKWQVPVITITYSSITSGTSKVVRIGNDNTGQVATITRTWLTGDVLEVDCYNRTIKVNGTEVAFTGAIPEWNTGFGYWSYADTFGARTFTGSITCVSRYV